MEPLAATALPVALTRSEVAARRLDAIRTGAQDPERGGVGRPVALRDLQLDLIPWRGERDEDRAGAETPNPLAARGEVVNLQSGGHGDGGGGAQPSPNSLRSRVTNSSISLFFLSSSPTN